RTGRRTGRASKAQRIVGQRQPALAGRGPQPGDIVRAARALVLQRTSEIAWHPAAENSTARQRKVTCRGGKSYFRSSNCNVSIITSQPGVILRILSAMTPRSETVAFFNRRLKSTIFLRRRRRRLIS